LEVTYNKDRDDYHPHFHVVLAVNKSYFTDKNYYINRNRWLELWQQSTKNPLITQVDVRRVNTQKIKKKYLKLQNTVQKIQIIYKMKQCLTPFSNHVQGKD